MFTFAPVAISARAKLTRSPPCRVAVRAPRSSAITFVRERSSTPFSSYQSTGFT
jgi:hypothetical protein